MDQNPVSGGDDRGLVDRLKAILVNPADEWPAIESEQAATSHILRHYVVPLAAIGPLATFLGGQIFGYGAFGFHFRPGLAGSLGTLIVGFVMSLVGLFVLAAIANVLAPKFGGQADSAGSFRLVAYSGTAGWVAGIFALIPSLGFLGILGLYSIFLFYTGAPRMLKVPQDKAAAFTGVTFLACIVLYVVAGAVMTAITRPLL